MLRCPRPIALTSVVAVGSCALLAAGCGGGGSPRVASISTSTTAAVTAQQGSGLTAYSACMRSHGVPSFPDPDSTGGIPKPQVIAASKSNPSRFASATDACRPLLPSNGLGPPQSAQQQRIRLADELSFASCMRSHGVSRFPDPTAQGDLSVARVQAQGIDVHSPAVLRDVQACLPASHGALTPAKVREALNGAHG